VRPRHISETVCPQAPAARRGYNHRAVLAIGAGSRKRGGTFLGDGVVIGLTQGSRGPMEDGALPTGEVACCRGRGELLRLSLIGYI
jgi:hypothetical protein